MLLMTRFHIASVQVNRHEGLRNLPSRKHRKERSTWNPTSLQTCGAMGRGCGIHISWDPVLKVSNFHLLSNTGHDSRISTLNSLYITCVVLES